MQLATQIEGILARPEFSFMSWGIQVDRQNGSAYTQIYGHREKEFRTPASNNKVITTVAALMAFGPDATHTTYAYMNADNDLCIKGSGDPTLTAEALTKLATTVRLRTKYLRNIILDDSIFPDFPDTWEVGDLPSTDSNFPVSFVVNHNTLSVLAQACTMTSTIRYDSAKL
jgi:D-alanyl-D-alanine carboxypeptidase